MNTRECPENERNTYVPIETPESPLRGVEPPLRNAQPPYRQSETHWCVRVHHPDPCDACGMRLIWPVAGNTSHLCITCFEREAESRRTA